MNIKFKELHLYNFLSFGDATISLNEGGYTLVCGVNNNPDDLAKSNGSGKSSIWEAIAWCLTGETIRGSKDIVNLKGTDGALVELKFDIDGHNYHLLRSKDHSKYKTTLKIFIDNEDKSGKGIRDSEKLLAEYLPDLTAQLIGSVIILGQGLPQRFTNNTPAGRKDVLEQLSKSDFMIEDLKQRISTRKSELNTATQEVTANGIVYDTKLKSNEDQYKSTTIRLESLEEKSILEQRIADAKLAEDSNKELVDANTQRYNELKSKYDELNSQLSQINTQRSLEESECKSKIDAQIAELNSQYRELSSNIRNLKAEINKLESIKDTCPTCGQKLPDVHKPDTTAQRAELAKLESESTEINSRILALNEDKLVQLKEIAYNYSNLTVNATNECALLAEDMKTVNRSIDKYNSLYNTMKEQRLRAEADRDNLDRLREDYNSTLAELLAQKSELEEKILYNDSRKAELSQHCEVVNKMSTVITRDFRGFLLTNVIDFINKKSKEYSKEVFETDKIEFKLSGNNISISYDEKEYENLSGGEKQKVDLIVQFAIRDMLCKFLNFSSNIIVLDELFDNLDSIGCQRVLNLISTKLADVDSIFIVTHHSDISIPMDKELIVEKGADGISRVK